MAKEKKVADDVTVPVMNNKIVIQDTELDCNYSVSFERSEHERIARNLADSRIVHFTDGYRERNLFQSYDVLINLPFERFVYYNANGSKFTINCLGINSLTINSDSLAYDDTQNQPIKDVTITVVNSKAKLGMVYGDVYLGNAYFSANILINSTIAVDTMQDNRLHRKAEIRAGRIENSVVYDSTMFSNAGELPNLLNSTLNSSDLVGNVSLVDSKFYKTTFRVNTFSVVKGCNVTRCGISTDRISFDMKPDTVISNYSLHTDGTVNVTHPIMLGTLKSDPIRMNTWWSVENGKAPVFRLCIFNDVNGQYREIGFSQEDAADFDDFFDEIKEIITAVLGFKDDNLPGTFTRAFAKQFSNFAYDRMNICLFYLERSIADGLTEY